MSEDTTRSTETDIRQLDEDTVARIAAGEVVERPASAVKELVENALDADASRIDVAVEAGGTELIRVADDGRGMNEADVRAAVRQHTTSKIRDLADLESGVSTLGFRGEALHTIGSVSRLTVKSRPRSVASDDGAADPSGGGRSGDGGTKLVFEGGEVASVEPAGCPEGTIVEVADLFYNTPARRKFLKTTATEFARVNRVVTRYALANPDVAVSLTHDGREVFATTGQGDLQAAVLSVYGREVARSMIAVEADGDSLPPGPVDAVSGLVSHPETNRSSRDYLATYVNDRAVTADAVREGIMGAYGNQLGGDRYPFVVLFLDVPGDAVDVNVHPRKREVRFDDEDAVRRQVDAAIERTLLDHGLLRSGAPRGRSAPDEARVEPDRPRRERDPDGTQPDTSPPADTSSDGNAGERSEKPPSTEDASTRASENAGTTDSEAETGGASATDRTPDSESGSADESADSRAASPSEPTRGSVANEPSSDPETGTDGRRSDDSRGRAVDARDGDPHRGAGRKFAAATEQRTLGGEAATGEETEFDSLPPLRVLGHLHDTYVVCETPEGLALIDQHAADERVNYERLREAFAADPAAQALASPVDLELTAAEAEAFEGYREALSRLGFYADRVDDRTVSVTTVPAVLEETVDPDRLRDVLASFVEGDRDAGAETVDALADAFLADLACYPSVTGNTSLTEGSIVDLLRALDDCENPYACPHGRPVIVRLSEDEVEERFERDYPGHGG